MDKARILVAGIAVGLLSLTLPAPAGAVDFGGKLALHGYGNWSYARTDGNSYVNGTDEGSWDTMEFSLGLAAEPAEKFTVHAQAFWEMSEEGAESSMDFAFAEYAFSPAVALRAGKVKQPFGIYTEIFDVGVLAPFNNLPQGIYGPSGFVAEAYMGVGVTGALDITGALRLQYDLYGGELESALTTPWAEDETEEQSTDVQDMVGGRVQVGTADGGYTAGVSGYTGAIDTGTFGEETHGDRHSAVGAHAEAMLAAFTLRTEFAYQAAEIYSASAAYLEGSYLLAPNWRVALRYDWTRVDPDGGEEVAPALVKSTDFGVALNYIVNPNFVVKLAYHAVDGNRFTESDEDQEVERDEKTSLITAGVSFSF